MRWTFDAAGHALYLYVTDDAPDHQQELTHNVVADRDPNGTLVGLEIIDVRCDWIEIIRDLLESPIDRQLAEAIAHMTSPAMTQASQRAADSQTSNVAGRELIYA